MYSCVRRLEHVAAEVVLAAGQVRAEMKVDDDLAAPWRSDGNPELFRSEVRVVDGQVIGRSIDEKPEQEILDVGVGPVRHPQR